MDTKLQILKRQACESQEAYEAYQYELSRCGTEMQIAALNEELEFIKKRQEDVLNRIAAVREQCAHRLVREINAHSAGHVCAVCGARFMYWASTCIKYWNCDHSLMKLSEKDWTKYEKYFQKVAF